MAGLDDISADATLVKYSVIGGAIILIGVVGFFIYEKIVNSNIKLPNAREIQDSVIASNPVTKYIQATAIRGELKNSDPDYKNAKVIFTNNIQTNKQLTNQNPNYSGPVIDITPTQTTGQFINLPKINSSNNLGTNDNPYNFKNGYQGEGYYNHINKLVLVVYILDLNMYDQLSNKNYSSVF